MAATAAEPAQDLVRMLGRREWPTAEGAIGRNRQAWFHARFQMGLHRLADLAVLDRDLAAAEAYVRALEYTCTHLEPDGGYRVAVPTTLAASSSGGPSAADLASGTAFYLASVGSGWLRLYGSSWFRDDGSCAALRERLALRLPDLRRSAGYLARQADLLLQADARAPNRLLFNALALRSLGHLLGDAELVSAASPFRDSALALLHEDGYFIEGGGYDSSYNAVALAIGLRLRAAGDDDADLANGLRRALAWQRTRITPEGRVMLDGNARVRDGDGESFLGQAKGMDVPHLIEALLLAAHWHEEPELVELATRIARAAGARLP